MMRTTPGATIHTPHNRKPVFFPSEYAQSNFLNCGDVSFIRDEQSSSLFTRQPFPEDTADNFKDRVILFKKKSSSVSLFCYVAPVPVFFGFDAPKDGLATNIGGLLAPRSG